MLDKLKELEQNDEFMEALGAATNGEQIEALFKSQGITFNYEDLEKMGFGVDTGELNESQLMGVAGGARVSYSYLSPSFSPGLFKLSKYLYNKYFKR